MDLQFRFCTTHNTPYEKIGDNEPVSIADEIPFDIPDSWEWARLGDVFLTIMGQSPSGDTIFDSGDGIEFHQGKIYFSDKYLSKSSAITTSPTKIAPPNSVLLCVRAPVGKVNITNREICIGRGLCAVVPLGGITVDYVFFLLETYEDIFTRQATGSTFVAITGDVVKNQLVPIPPIDEQLRIISMVERIIPFIKQYDAREIDLTKLNKTFPDLLKKSIFQQAVQGKLVPQDPNDEPASVLLESIRAEKERLKAEGKIKRDKNESVIYKRDNSHYEKVNGIERCIDDEIPFDIPDSWVWTRLNSILKKLTDGTHSTPKYVPDGVPFISVKDVSSGKLSFDSCKYITIEEHKELYSRCDPEYGDILLTKVGTTGVPAIVDTKDEFSLFVSVALLKFNQNLIYNKYLYYLINSPLVQTQAEENTKGVGNKNWVMRDIAQSLIVIPPLNEQYRIVKKIEQLFSYCQKL